MKRCGVRQQSFFPADPAASNARQVQLSYRPADLGIHQLAECCSHLVESLPPLVLGQAFRLVYFPEDIQIAQDPPGYLTNMKTWTFTGGVSIGIRSGPLITYGASATLFAVVIT